MVADKHDPAVMDRFFSDRSPGFAAGGPRNGMASRTGAMTAHAGCTVAQNTGMGPDFAVGGTGSMQRFTPVVTRAPSHTGGQGSIAGNAESRGRRSGEGNVGHIGTFKR